MDDLLRLLEETGIPFAYDHFTEGESPDPPFICYLLPQSNHFSADGKVYLKVSSVNIELYTDSKDPVSYTHLGNCGDHPKGISRRHTGGTDPDG